MTEASADPRRAARMRDQLVDKLIVNGDVVSKRVESVMRTVPRHLFVPEATLEDAYEAYNSVVTKRNEQGTAVSSVSAPQIQAMMLEQADVAPSMRVLEVGSGGLNAAYLAELVGEDGEVTTADIDPEVTARAESLLYETGYAGRVRVALADAIEGIPEHAPYDRILVTAGAWDIPPTWITQLSENGRLVVPLRIKGLTRSVAFQRVGDHLSSTSARPCGFVPLRGGGAHEDQLLLLNGTEEIILRFDGDMPADPSPLNNAVRMPRTETWTGVTVRHGEPIDTLQLYLATLLPGFCTMAVDPDLDTGLVAPRTKRFSLATVDGSNVAYVTSRLTADETSFEYGVHALGPEAAALAETVADHVRTWARDHRGGPGPHIAVHPFGTPDDRLPKPPVGRVIGKVHCRVTLSWPTAAAAAGLRGRLLEELRDRGDVVSSRVAAAFAEVPRHRFVPEATLEEAYANDAVVTKRNERGHAISSVSAPWIQARMLELSGLAPGMRVLEIGSGGYNAALMAEIVGEGGEVVSVDIDRGVTDRAARLLAQTGYGRVRVVCADGTYGAGELVPEGGFDAIVVTAQAPDLPPAWSDQLAEAGRLVVPLSLRGTRQIFAFEHEGGHLRSHGRTECGFVGMQGDNRHGGRTIDLSGEDLRLSLDDDQQADAEALRSAVASSPQSTVWTGVTLRNNEGVLPSLNLWLISTLDPCARTLYASTKAVERGLSGWSIVTAATWESGTLAYITVRPDTTSGPGGFELGVHAYGPDRELLAARLADRIRDWDSGGHRGSVEPTIRAYPLTTPEDELAPGQVITNRYSRLVISRS
jgi:protein-L-isoaspartate(D-aspartate) O-methyltransferase